MESIYAVQECAIKNILDILNGKKPNPEFIINKEVYIKRKT